LPFFLFFFVILHVIYKFALLPKREKNVKKMKGASTWATAQSNPLAQKAHVADYSLAAGSPT
jgi:hypothetical protein